MEDEEGGVEKGKMTEEMNVKEGHFHEEGEVRRATSATIPTHCVLMWDVVCVTLHPITRCTIP